MPPCDQGETQARVALAAALVDPPPSLIRRTDAEAARKYAKSDAMSKR
jgi:hypothetical protein